MGLVVRQSIFSTGIIFFGVALGAFNTLWLFPAILSTEEIGLFRVVVSMATLLVPFAQFGMVQTSIKFYPLQKTEGDKNSFQSAILLISLLSFIGFAILFFLFKEQIVRFFIEQSPIVNEHLNLVVGLILFMTVFGIFESYCRNNLNIVLPNLVKDVFLRIVVVALVVSYFLGIIGFETILIGLLINYVFASVILLSFLYIRYGLRLKWPGKIPNLKQLLEYAVYNLLGTTGAAIVLHVDSILVTGLLGLTQNGIYTTVFFMAVVVEIPRRPVSQIVTPILSSAFSREAMDEVKSIYQKSSINLLIIGGLIYLLIASSLDQIFYLIPDWQRFAPGKEVVLILGLAKLLDIASGVNTEVIIMSKYYRFHLISILFLSALTIILDLLMIPAYGIQGAAIATAISIVLFNLIKFIFIWVKYNIQPFTLKTLLAVFLISLCMVLGKLLPAHELALLSIFYKSIVLSLVFIGLNLALKTSVELNELFSNLLRRIRS